MDNYTHILTFTRDGRRYDTRIFCEAMNPDIALHEARRMGEVIARRDDVTLHSLRERIQRHPMQNNTSTMCDNVA
jgi:hypothetical protein